MEFYFYMNCIWYLLHPCEDPCEGPWLEASSCEPLCLRPGSLFPLGSKHISSRHFQDCLYLDFSELTNSAAWLTAQLFLYWKKLRLREVTEDGAVCVQPVSWFYICYPSNLSSSRLLSFLWLFKKSQSQILMVMEPLPLCNSSCRPCWVPQNHENIVTYVIEMI